MQAILKNTQNYMDMDHIQGLNNMKKDIMRSIALFLTGLIISLPLYSATVFAGLIDTKVYGVDEIEGYLRDDSSEILYINTTAQISGDNEIKPEQLHLTDPSGPIFNSCNDIGNGNFECMYTSDTSSISSNPFNFNVILYDDNDNFKSSVTVSGVIDETPPEIESFSISPSVLAAGNLTLSYKIHEHAYSSTDSNKCIGIKKIEFSSADKGTFKEIYINSTAGDCNIDSNLEIPVSEVTNSDGTIDITLTAYDNFDQASSEIKQFNYDVTPPSISSLEIEDSDEESIDFIGEDSVQATVSFTVYDDNLDTSDVYANISQINIDAGTDYEKKQASCSTSDDVEYECSFSNVEVKLDESKTIKIKINATDLAGNTITSTLTKSIEYDVTAPSITSITTEYTYGDVYYVGDKTTFVVEIQEEGIGIDAEDVKLDLSNIQSGLSSEEPDECEESGSTYECYWYNISCSKDDDNVSITVKSATDKIGNAIEEEVTQYVIIDRTSPSITAASATAVGVGSEAIEGYIKTGDSMDILLNVTEVSTLSAYADISAFVTTNGNETGSCSVVDGDEWQCTWSSDPIDVGGYISSDIEFQVIDLLGNAAEYDLGIDVYDHSNETNVSYWTSEVKCSPELIDRQITSLVAYKVLCSIELTPLTSNQSTISIELDQCYDNPFSNTTGYDSTAYISSVELINADEGTTNPYFDITLTQAEMPINNLSFYCPISIISKVEDSILQEAEIENITIGLGLYNMPLGELDESLIEKIRDVEDDAFVGMEWIKSLKTILFYSENICGLLDLWNKIMVFWAFIETASEGQPIYGTSSARVSSIVEKGTMGKDNIFMKFCKYISCDYTLYGNWYTGQKSLWASEMRTAGRGFAQSGDKEVGVYENWLKKYDIGTMWPESPKESILFSLATGCLPGIIYGIEKWRQIQCNYGVCLYYSGDNDILQETCEDQKEYLECTFLWGEVVQWLPFYWVRQLGSYIATILSDPLALIFGFVGFFCPDKPGGIHGGCAIARGLVAIPEILGDLQNLFDSEQWQIQGDMCEIFFDEVIEELECEEDEEGECEEEEDEGGLF